MQRESERRILFSVLLVAAVETLAWSVAAEAGGAKGAVGCGDAKEGSGRLGAAACAEGLPGNEAPPPPSWDRLLAEGTREVKREGGARE